MARRIGVYLVCIFTILRIFVGCEDTTKDNMRCRASSENWLNETIADELSVAAVCKKEMTALMATGCTDSVMTTTWTVEADKKLEEDGLQMLKVNGRRNMFRGLGGHSVQAVNFWRMPCNIDGKATTHAPGAQCGRGGMACHV